METALLTKRRQLGLLGRNIYLKQRANRALNANIYDPFFTTKPAGEGTGLVLWFSYDTITKGSGGTLSVETWEVEFTEFVVTLPATPAAAAKEEALQAPAAALGWAD